MDDLLPGMLHLARDGGETLTRQLTDQLRRLSVDAHERRTEQPEHTERQRHGDPPSARHGEAGNDQRAEQRVGEQDRDAPPDRASRIAHSGVERRERSLDQRRPLKVFDQGDDHRDRKRGAHAFGQA